MDAPLPGGSTLVPRSKVRASRERARVVTARKVNEAAASRRDACGAQLLLTEPNRVEGAQGPSPTLR